MRIQNFLTKSEGSLLGDFAARMSVQLVRDRANLEVRAARAVAENAIKARSEFLANMNHELRTPLNAIIGFATMLRDGADYGLDDARREEYAEYILQSADLLLGHINTILEVAALESGGVELNQDDIDLNALLSEALDRAAIRADAAGVEIVRRDEGESIPAFGDIVRAGQALDHILQAAINACEEGERILVRASRDETGRPEIAIRDEGAGMSEDELDEALDTFSRDHRGLDQAFNRPGVGYAIAKTFVELQGGRFHIRSRQGRGTLVRLVFPEQAADAPSRSDGLNAEQSDAA